MDREAAAAILTQVYADWAQPNLTKARPNQTVNVEAVDEIGHIYAAFLARLDVFQGWGRQYPGRRGGVGI